MSFGRVRRRLGAGYFFGVGAVIVVGCTVVVGCASDGVVPGAAEISMLITTDLTPIGSLETWRIWPPCT